ncbi:hypothetical protein H072_9010 [Dactylellina haptotyla CBS 200.50]|uniref:BSD domain-containing protein n=1 Tax=Dactylellina haptotyla (strain CBS 200.50) TaxID=1284197 RepID=S8A896_DACHA|nr:hypothetical protein H072_9010 [Dactylellina haptotyla CBS 200.50]
MSSATATAAYKKKDGILSLATDGKSLIWQAVLATIPSAPIVIPVDTITNLQATPPTSTKVMIKVFAQSTPKSTIDQYVFTFTSSSEDATTLKAALTAAIQAIKSANEQELVPAGGDDKENINESVTPKFSKILKNRTDVELKNDMALQQAVLSSSPTLQKKFHEVVVEGNMTATQFWSTRVHLLRAHAVERSQSRGSYNVLASIKPKNEDSVVRVSLSRDQIHTIFEQHPIVRKVYDEVVPKLREDDFWRRFFLSKLYKKLKGEKLVPTDAHDDVLDQYLKTDDSDHTLEAEYRPRIPHTIDLGGNEDNHSQKQGNRPDLTMRPNKIENVPIIRTLNNLSSKLLDFVTPVDVADGPPNSRPQDIGNSKLRDLQADTREQNVLLHVKNHKQFFDLEIKPARNQQLQPVAMNTQTSTILSHLYHDTASSNDFETNIRVASEDQKPRLSDNLYNSDTVSTEDMISLRSASTQISSILSTRRLQMPGRANRPIRIGSHGFSQNIWDQLLLTHATSTEFLRHFWDAFFSGDPRRTAEIRQMVNSLARSQERIENIALSAEEEKKIMQEIEQRESDRKRSRFGNRANDTGYPLVKRVIGPQEAAIKTALTRYERALETEAPKLLIQD